jgi:hypothetical protein
MPQSPLTHSVLLSATLLACVLPVSAQITEPNINEKSRK